MNFKDQYLIIQIRRGHIKSFEELFHRFYPGLCLYAKSILKNHAVSEEIVQDLFYNIWKNRDKLSITISLQSYLYKSVYNNSASYLRKVRREVQMDEKLLVSQPDHSGDPSNALNLKELNNTIERTLNNLPARTREIFTLSRYEGLKYHDIAFKLSISIKTVEANMGRALKALRSSLKELNI